MPAAAGLPSWRPGRLEPHPDTLTSRNNLVAAYEAAGRRDEAIPLFERTLADYERVLGETHPDTRLGVSLVPSVHPCPFKASCTRRGRSGITLSLCPARLVLTVADGPPMAARCRTVNVGSNRARYDADRTAFATPAEGQGGSGLDPGRPGRCRTPGPGTAHVSVWTSERG
jgi:hypothetical protein